MLKLKWQHRLRLWLWQHRRLLVLSSAALLAMTLLLAGNILWLALPAIALPLLSAGQLAIGGFAVALVLILAD
ncbi:hypothetical protein [Rheinheimera texasensis]|uniref:hypothetical protein n=1 Tax=Rheinheimera texasensis TaxID=306205 RepID=UPI0032B30A12